MGGDFRRLLTSAQQELQDIKSKVPRAGTFCFLNQIKKKTQQIRALISYRYSVGVFQSLSNKLAMCTCL